MVPTDGEWLADSTVDSSVVVGISIVSPGICYMLLTVNFMLPEANYD